MRYLRFLLFVFLGWIFCQYGWEWDTAGRHAAEFSSALAGALRSQPRTFHNLHDPVTFVACGDVVMHLPLVQAALQPDGAYNFRPIFAGLKPALGQADIATCVLETSLATTVGDRYTGYPLFNSPGAVADALQWAGFDLVFTAHNHSLDRRFAGIEATAAYLDRIGLAHVGTRSSPQQPRYFIARIKDITLAFLSYTTTTNGISLPSGREWAVNFFDDDKIAADIAAAKRAGADCIVMAVHTGIEYRRLPTTAQTAMADRLLAMGVDIILGSHVHVIEPWEHRLLPEAGPGGPRSCFVAYSLGNLLSNQRWRYSDCGLLLRIMLQRRTAGPGVDIVNVTPLPLWVNRYRENGRSQYRIVVIDSPNGPMDGSFLNPTARRRIQEVWEETFELWRNWRRDQFGR